MSVVVKIAMRRIKRNYKSSILFCASLLFSVFFISFFVLFFVTVKSSPNLYSSELPFRDFIGYFQSCVIITVVFLSIFVFTDISRQCRARSSDIIQTASVLTGIGASKHQISALINTELAVLYLPQLIIGGISGGIAGVFYGARFAGELSVIDYSISAAAIAALLSAYIVFVIACNYLPEILRGRVPVIQGLRLQNRKASVERHSYRQSTTFKTQRLTARLAKKSVEYNSGIYNGISFSFAVSALYPVLAFLLFYYTAKSEVVLDLNPYDGIDTAAAVISELNRIFRLLGVCFALLTAVGAVNTVLMVRLQLANRRKTALIYAIIGMQNDDINKMIMSEFKSVLIRSFVIWLFGAVTINSAFMML